MLNFNTRVKFKFSPRSTARTARQEGVGGRNAEPSERIQKEASPAACLPVRQGFIRRGFPENAFGFRSGCGGNHWQICCLGAYRNLRFTLKEKNKIFHKILV